MGFAAEEKIEMYPNPVAHTLNIALPNEEQATIQLRSLSNTVIRQIQAQGKTAQMNVSDIKTGLYIIHIIKKSGIVSRKVEVTK